MLEIVNKIEELYGLLTIRLKEVENLKAKLVSETARLDGKEASLSQKDVELSKRESIIGEIESIKLMRKEADDAIEASKKELDRIIVEKKMAAESIAIEKATLVDMNASVKSNIEGLKVREAKLKADQEALEKDKATYKNTIIKSFDKKG